MEIKRKRFFALPHMERATKLLMCLILILLINCSNVFASARNDFEYFVKNNIPNFQENINYSEIINKISDFENIVIIKSRTFTYPGTEGDQVTNRTYYTNYYIMASNNEPYIQISNYNGITLWGPLQYIRIELNEKTGLYNCEIPNREESSYRIIQLGYNNEKELIFTSTQIKDTKGNIIYEPTEKYKEPYFEFSVNEIGIIKDENIPCFYPSSFDTGVNSYASYKKIGKLYIDENYTLDYIYGSIPIITVTNLEETKTWQYPNYLIFTDNIIKNGYKTYYINIDISYINTPYIYSMDFISYYPDLGENINIKFALLTKESQNGGGIIIESGDTQISGDFNKDETTLGDIENSLKEPYNPNNSILNEMDSGDILENIGYETQEDPNQHIWDTIVNGMKNVLCGTGDQILIFEFKGKQYPIKSSEIKQPEGVLKIFTGLAVDFFLLMQMYQFIKKTIDQINEGDLKVMHDVDADCYFF